MTEKCSQPTQACRDTDMVAHGARRVLWVGNLVRLTLILPDLSLSGGISAKRYDYFNGKSAVVALVIAGVDAEGCFE